MKNIIINSNGLVVNCYSMRFNFKCKTIVTLCNEEGNCVASLYIDEAKLKYKFQNDVSKYYDVVGRM